jgi:hypothetical protein
MSERERVYHRVTLVFSVTILGFGLAAVVRTIAAGGGPTSLGILIGVLFIALGLARGYLAVRAMR